MEYTVRLTNRAERETDVIYAYIYKRSPDGADRWDRALYAALALLQENPSGRPLSPEGAQFEAAVRQILFKTRKGLVYRALFSVTSEDNVVNILSVRGPAQDLLTQDEIDQAMKQR